MVLYSAQYGLTCSTSLASTLPHTVCNSSSWRLSPLTKWFFADADVVSTPGIFGFGAFLSALTFGLYSKDDHAIRDQHLLGQHTVRMSPISTAFLNPYGQTFCLPTPSSSVLIPVLLNNSYPYSLQYAVTPLGGGSSQSVTLAAKDLKAIEHARTAHLRLTKTSVSKQDTDYDEEEEEEVDEEEEGNLRRDSHSNSPRLQKTQSLEHIRISSPGTIRLTDVKDSSGVYARIVYPSQITVAPCPRAQFDDDDVLIRGDNVKCAAPELGVLGNDKDIKLGLRIHGVPPLSLKWYKEINARREYFVVEGIEAGHESHSEPSETHSAAAQEIQVPLTVSAEALGTHTYVLESVVDAIGNMQHLGLDPSARSAVASKDSHGILADSNTKISRTLHVLRRPKVSFKTCGPATPVSLRIGSEVSLAIGTKDADVLDGPWDVTVRYQPPVDESGKPINKRYQPWQQTLQTKEGTEELGLKTQAPGEYTILDVKGKHCAGDVLSPETCRVLELPKPSAEIEWKRIHEWYALNVTAGCVVSYQLLLVLVTQVYQHHLSCMARRPL